MDYKSGVSDGTTSKELLLAALLLLPSLCHPVFDDNGMALRERLFLL